MEFTKQPKTLEEQIELLFERGLKIHDVDYARYHLTNISYYRLSAYFLSFQKYGDPNHSFMPWATFQRVVQLYVFDRELRLICLDAIEKIEVAIRCRIIYEYCLRHGNNWYENEKLYAKKFNDVKKKVHWELENSKEVFIKHYFSKYNSPKMPPAWMALEVLSFGQLSTLFKNLHANEAKKAVAEYFGISYSVLESWIEHLVYIRNLCAHHSRLWNRKLTVTPTIPNNTKFEWINVEPVKEDKVYLTLCILTYLLEKVSYRSAFTGRIKALNCRFPKVDIRAAGFPKDWSKDPFWTRIHIPVTYHARIYFFKCKELFTRKVKMH